MEGRMNTARSIRFVSLVLLLIAVPLLASCGGQVQQVVVTQEVPVEVVVTKEVVVDLAPKPRNGTQFVVAMSMRNDPSQETEKLYLDQIRKAFEGFGAKYIECSGKSSAVTQANCIDNFIAQDVDLIAIWPVDNIAIASSIDKADAAKIPVFTFIATVPADTKAKVTFSMNVDNAAAARNAGNALVKALTEKYGSPRGTVLEITGLMTEGNAKLRRQGFHEVVEKYPDIKITEKPGDWDTSKAATITTDWFTAHPDTDAVYVHSDCNYLPGVESSLKALGMWKKMSEEGHVIGVGQDGCNLTLYDVKFGYWDMSSDFAIGDLGRVFTYAPLQYLKTGKIPALGDGIVDTSTYWKFAVVANDPDAAGGLVMYINIVPVTAFEANDPRLFGNQFQPEPNGLTVSYK
ncbi:MAG: hypothetical protein A2139_11115 [Desulfobacca sp. RBG_16_60_12]|nr:MAG: hypothetical protein A2139_11115 [Desulfobacca sp. RBG_16_60_12]